MMTEVLNVDEFGRDLDLRKNVKNRRGSGDYVTGLLKKYKGMSWAEMTFAIEEEEEEEELRKVEEERKKESQRLKKEDEERRYLYIIGQYELEEGEVFE
jgi:hypothetical protein